MQITIHFGGDLSSGSRSSLLLDRRRAMISAQQNPYVDRGQNIQPAESDEHDHNALDHLHASSKCVFSHVIILSQSQRRLQAPHRTAMIL